MAADENSESSASDDRLSLLYEGGLADNGALLLPEYAASLDGWRDLFQLLGELYFHSFPELQKVRGANLLRIEVVAENWGQASFSDPQPPVPAKCHAFGIIPLRPRTETRSQIISPQTLKTFLSLPQHPK
jgi:hypothetical protein